MVSFFRRVDVPANGIAMLIKVNSAKRKVSPFGLLSALTMFLLLVFASPSQAQLNDEEIEVMQARAESEGWTFEMAKNPATEYSLDQLCGLVEPRELA